MTAYIASQLRQRPRRAAGVVAGVALGAMLFVALSAVSSGFRRAARAPLAAVAADMVVSRPAGAGESSAAAQRGRGVRMPFGLAAMTEADTEVVARTEGVAAAAGALQLWDFGPRETTTVVGVDPAAIDRASDALGPGRALAGPLAAGRPFRRDERGAAVLDLHYARFYGLDTGSEVQVGDRRFGVVGIVEVTGSSQAAAANVYLPLAEARLLAGLPPGTVNQVYLRVAGADEVDAVVARLTDRLGPVSVVTEDSLVQVMGAVARVSSRFAVVAGVVALAGGLLLGWAALEGLVAERRREIGVLKAVGWRRADVARAFLAEAVVLSVLGAVAGLVLGLGAAALLARLPVPVPSLAHEGHEVPGQEAAGGAEEQRLPAGVAPGAAAGAVAAVAAAGTLAGWRAARRAASLPPAWALRAP